MEDTFEKNNPAADSQSGTPPADLLGALLSNPELIKRIGSVLGAMRNNEEGASVADEPNQSTSSTPKGAVPTAAAGDGLATLLQNPSVLEKLPQMLSVLKPMMENGAAKAAASDAAVRVAPHSSAHSREHLLLSLKPFLSKERCDAVDTILRISQLGEALGKLK